MVESLGTSVVVPSAVTPSHSIWLSNLDLLVARAHVPTVYFYRSTGDANFFAVETLKAALGAALVHFYPLAGRLGLDQTGRIEIKCTGEGLPFVVARSEWTVDDFGDFSPSDEMRKMLVPSAESGDPPLVMIQVILHHFFSLIFFPLRLMLSFLIF